LIDNNFDEIRSASIFVGIEMLRKSLPTTSYTFLFQFHI